MDDVLERETRKKIYDLIIKNPGLHLSKIAEMLKMRTSLAEYHLIYLENNNLIHSVKDEGGYYRRFYVKEGDIGTEDKKIFSLLRQETPLKIIAFLLRNPKFRHRDMLKELHIASSTLSYHINKLVSKGIIEVITYGEDKGYRIVNKKKIIQLLLKYEFRTIVDDFKDVWDDLHYWK